MTTAAALVDPDLGKLRLYEYRLHLARESPAALPFRAFVEAAWPVIEPKAFVGGYHVDAIAEHLQAVSDGVLRNLVINLPPRHTKSTLTNVLWPAWDWTRAPWLRWLFASYGADLSIRDSVRCRRLIESAWYRERYGRVFRLEPDQNQKTRYENDKGGRRIATSVGGTGTGEGGHRLIVDDPTKADEAESATTLATAIDWFDGTLSTRGDDPADTSKVVIMQRLHQRDLTGHIVELMQQGGESFDHLVLPAEYEPTVQVCLAGLEHDPRTQPGEALWPARWPTERLQVLKVSLGDRAAGQLQQRPAPAGGAIFRREWWDGRNRYDAADPRLRNLVVGRWLLLDTAMKDAESNDYTACLEAELLPDYRLVVRSVWWERLQFPGLLSAIEDQAIRSNRDGKLRGVVIEDKNSGTSALQTLKLAAPPWLSAILVPFQPAGSKTYRARQASLWCARDCVLLPHPSAEAPWLHDFEETVFTFPAAAHDDPVDTLSMALLYLEHLVRAGYQSRGGQLIDVEAA